MSSASVVTDQMHASPAEGNAGFKRASRRHSAPSFQAMSYASTSSASSLLNNSRNYLLNGGSVATTAATGAAQSEGASPVVATIDRGREPLTRTKDAAVCGHPPPRIAAGTNLDARTTAASAAFRRARSHMRCSHAGRMQGVGNEHRARSADVRSGDRMVRVPALCLGHQAVEDDTHTVGAHVAKPVYTARGSASALNPRSSKIPACTKESAARLAERFTARGGSTSSAQRCPIPFKTLPSTVFGGKYAIGRYLGRGASASVWEATHTDSKLQVAVKVFDQGCRDKKQAHREMKILTRLRHPRILEVFEVSETTLCAQLVCELINGESLRCFAQRQPFHRLNEPLAQRLYRQVVEGVSFCHDRLVVHRDLKLENLLLDRSVNNLKIIDFGFAAQVASKEVKLRAFCGTPSYMAPEIIRGEGYSGFATDVWALGVVAFALLAGMLPFAARTELQLYSKIRRGHFACPEGLCDLPKRLIRAALRMDPTARPTSATILHHDWVSCGVATTKTGPAVASPSDACAGQPADCNPDGVENAATVITSPASSTLRVPDARPVEAWPVPAPHQCSPGPAAAAAAGTPQAMTLLVPSPATSVACAPQSATATRVIATYIGQAGPKASDGGAAADPDIVFSPRPVAFDKESRLCMTGLARVTSQVVDRHKVAKYPPIPQNASLGGS